MKWILNRENECWLSEYLQKFTASGKYFQVYSTFYSNLKICHLNVFCSITVNNYQSAYMKLSFTIYLEPLIFCIINNSNNWLVVLSEEAYTLSNLLKGLPYNEVKFIVVSVQLCAIYYLIINLMTLKTLSCSSYN